MKTLLAVGICSLLLTSASIAAPMLKSQVLVTTPIVTVGDMFDGADLYAEEALFRSPAPGTTGRVSLNDVRIAAAKIGLTEFDPPVARIVTVARFGQVIEASQINDMIADSLRQKGFLRDGVTAEISFSTPFPYLIADTSTDPISLVTLNYAAGSGGFTARFLVSGEKKPLDLQGRAVLMVSVPHLSASLLGDSIIRPEDVEMRTVPVRTADTGSFSALDQVIGMQLKRPARAGKMLQPGDLKEPVLIGRNEAVTIVYRAGPMTLTVKGQALGDAAYGESVQVLNLMSSRVLSAIASDRGTVTLAALDTPATTIR
jgi:flagellar basal body P-ring formation protein FlgA